VTPSDPHYRQRRRDFDRCLTLFGRKPVLEALEHPAVRCLRLHLATSNRPAPILDRISELAERDGAELHRHDRLALSRISRNGRQDQGVAADIVWDGYCSLDDFLARTPGASAPLVAVDRVHNPQNLGMLIRAVTAGRAAGLLLPRRGGCRVDGLVIKASAGTVFRARLVLCDSLPEGLDACREAGYEVCVLEADAAESLFDYQPAGPCVMVLGNESEGVSADCRQRADRRLSIPLANGVESLNLAVTGALVAFSSALAPGPRAHRPAGR
jgi:23S rRNA (guanosine2251-2'-O)-methyltransferase